MLQSTARRSTGPGEQHTITFLAGSAAPLRYLDAKASDGRPLLLLNPRVMAPTVPPTTSPVTYDGKSFLTSGLLNAAVLGTGRSFVVTFTTPGTYRYQCIVHANMHGSIVVRPSGSWPPLVVDGNAAQPSDKQVTFAFTVRNAGTQPVTGIHVAIPIPAGTSLVDSWAGTEGSNAGADVGSEVQWYGPDVTLQPEATYGPFAITVSTGAGVNPTTVLTQAWVQFGSGPEAGSAISTIDR